MKEEVTRQIAIELSAPAGGSNGEEGTAWSERPTRHVDRSPHEVQFYNTDESLVKEVSAFLGAALTAGNSALVVAAPGHRRGFANELEARGLNLATVLRQGRYIELDAGEALARFLVDGRPDDELFARVLGGAVLRANSASQASAPRAAIFGEMVALLWAAGKVEASLQLERLWNNLGASHSFALRCAYPLQGFSRPEHIESFQKICALHSAIIPTEKYSAADSEEPSRSRIAEWQQEPEAPDAHAQLAESKLLFHLFANAVQDYAIFFLDPEGNVTTWNPGAERIKGYKAFEIIGKHFSTFYPDEDIWSRKPQRELEIAARVGRIEDEGWRLRKAGSRFWANVVITAIHDQTGKLLGFAKITRDFTERMRAQEMLRRTNLELAAEMADRKSAEKKLAASEKSLRELSLRLLRSQDEERKRIGRDLHDSLGQYLAMLKLNLEMVQPALNGHDEEAALRFSDCVRLADVAIKEVRTLSYLLYPPMLEETGLKSAIDWYLAGFSKRSNIQTSFEADPDFARFPREIELALFRVLQESLTNVHRHSQSATASIRLFVADGTVALQIRDAGRGIPADVLERLNDEFKRSTGVGLRGMEERLRHLGGKLEVSSSEHGTTIRASVPAGEGAGSGSGPSPAKAST